jgi:uncharacterized protein (TIGR02300 family)
MEASDRGARHICPDCATRYYDLKKAVVACPKCGTKPPAPKLARAARPPKDAPRTNNRMTMRR